MPFLLTVASDDDRRVIVESLRLTADQRTRVARRAAGDVAADKRAGKDVRSSAVKIAGLLDEANTLTQVADELAAAPNLPVITDAVRGVTPPTAEQALAVVAGADTPADDGTSPEAQAAADLAGLTDNPEADPDAVEDEHGALPEDAAGAVESVL